MRPGLELNQLSADERDWSRTALPEVAMTKVLINQSMRHLLTISSL